jgi:hypothetical protein
LGAATRRERRLWGAALAWMAAIDSTLYVARPAAELLRRSNLLRLTVWGAIAVLGAAVLAWGLRRRLPGRAWGLLAAGAAVFLALVWPLSPAEVRLHCVEYGILGGLFYLALAERAPRWALVSAVLLGGAAGWLDEGIQYLLPNRTYDLADAALNLAAAALWALVLALLRPVLATAPPVDS